MYIKNFGEAWRVAVNNGWKKYVGANVSSDIMGVAQTENGVVLYISTENNGCGLYMFPQKASVDVLQVVLHDQAYGKPISGASDRNHAIEIYNSKCDDKIIRVDWRDRAYWHI